MQRRELLSLASGMVAGGLLSTAEPLRRRVDSALALPTNAHDLDEWERTADQYAHLVSVTSTRETLPQLLADLDEARLRMEGAVDGTRSGMIRVCGLLSALVAFCFVQTGRFLEAGRYWRTAQRSAQILGDRQLHARVRGKRAVISLYSGASPQEILRLADDAVDIAGGTPRTPSVGTPRAQVFAHQGRHAEAVAELAEVEAVFERLPEAVLSARGVWGWSEARLRFVQSWVYSCGGRVSDAAEAQQAALALCSPSAWKFSTQIQLQRAQCIVVSGDPSEGARHTIRVLQALPPNCPPEGLVRHSASLVFDAMPAPALKLPVVRQARELLALPAGVT